MFTPVPGEFWLRRSIRFYPLFDSASGDGASWEMEVAPSPSLPASICAFPDSVIYRCLEGAASFQTEDGKFFLTPGICFRVPTNTRHLLKNEGRSMLKLHAVLNGNTGAENFLCALAETGDEKEILEEAKAYNVSLFLPETGPRKIDSMVAAENRIMYPRTMGFCL